MSAAEAVTVTLTAGQRDQAVNALHAKLSETRHYLLGYQRDTELPHDDCCKRNRAWLARRQEERELLRQQAVEICAALDVLERTQS